MAKKWKNGILLFMACLMMLTPISVCAESSSNYCYTEAVGKEYDAAPIAYEVDKVYYASDFEGVDSLGNLASMYVTENLVYVAKSDAILVLTHDFEVVHILSEYKDETGETAVITNPDGIFVTEDRTLYVCEPDKGHILVFDENYNLLHNYGTPEGLDLDVQYKPKQIVVDSLGRMYVVAGNVYEGILELSSDNVYQRYFGTTTVSISVLEIFYRAIASEEQLNRQSLLLPTEYSSMAIDSKGFIYTTIRSTEVMDPIRLLNVNGDDILPEDWAGGRPLGDIYVAKSGENAGASSLTYIDCNEQGMYMVLDSTRNRIFTYDERSNMLFVFGGSGDKDGCFRNPVSVRWLGEDDKVIVADRLSQSITVLKPTNYAKAILQASRYEYDGDRDSAVPYWEEALSMNANYSVAKDALIRYDYWEGDYDTAMELSKDIGRLDYYSKSFAKIREDVIREYAPGTVVAIAAVCVAVTVWKHVRRKQKGADAYAEN